MRLLTTSALNRAACALALASAASAQTAAFAVTARAGDFARSGSPAVARFAWPSALAATLAALESDKPIAWSASLIETTTKANVPCELLAIPAQADAPAAAELRFVVDNLAARGERHYRLTVGEAAARTDTFRTTSRDDARLLTAGDHTLLRVDTAFDRADFERTSKPIWHLFVPGTDVELTKGLGGEFPHHRGLFLGWNKTIVGTTTFDFWHCQDAGQRHAGHDPAGEVQSDARGAMTGTTHWLSPLDEVVVRDQRTLTFWRRIDGDTSEPTQRLDVDIELSADQVVALRGDPQHAGFQLRVADEVAQRKDARYVRPPSAQDAKDDVWTECPWVTGLFTIQGHAVAIQHMSHSSNPQPVSYSTRSYGRFGAYFAADLTPGRPLRLRYRLLVLAVAPATDVSAERFAREYADFVSPIEVSITGT